jgi:hypothetical protein
MVVSPNLTRVAFFGDLERGMVVGGNGGDGGGGMGKERDVGFGMKLAKGPSMARCSGLGV